MEVTLPLEQMTTAEKLQVLEAVWEDLCRAPGNVPSPAWHEELLRGREERLRDGTARMVDWPEAKEKIRDAAR
jgi:hypothetical protein